MNNGSQLIQLDQGYQKEEMVICKGEGCVVEYQPTKASQSEINCSYLSKVLILMQLGIALAKALVMSSHK